jgi:hypothetical protein
MTAEKRKKGSQPTICLTCRHYYVTWESDHPYGCKAFGFKSRKAPSAVVLESSGKTCRLFCPRD